MDITSSFDPQLRDQIDREISVAVIPVGSIEQHGPQLRDQIDREISVAVIPVGSIEQHGPHLPVSTDTDIVSEIARRVAKRCKFLLLPTIPYGVSFEHAPFFNLSIRSPTLRILLHDLCISLLDNNIETVFIINGHHHQCRQDFYR